MQELDEAARRRLPKQLYIPLPCADARRAMVERQLGPSSGVASALSPADVAKIVAKTDGYSGALPVSEPPSLHPIGCVDEGAITTTHLAHRSTQGVTSLIIGADSGFLRLWDDTGPVLGHWGMPAP